MLNIFLPTEKFQWVRKPFDWLQDSFTMTMLVQSFLASYESMLVTAVPRLVSEHRPCPASAPGCGSDTHGCVWFFVTTDHLGKLSNRKSNETWELVQSGDDFCK